MAELAGRRPIREHYEHRGRFIGIMGLPGSGKTSSARNLDPETTAFLTGEPAGLRALERFGWENAHIYEARAPEDWPGHLDRLLGRQDIRTVIIDTVTKYYERLMEDYLATRGMSVEELFSSKGGKWDRLGYGLEETKRLFIRMEGLVTRGRNVIVLMHTKDNKSETVSPDLDGQLPSQLVRRLEICCYARRAQGTDGAKLFTLDLLSGDSYGKDLFDIAWPLENDIAKLLELCREAAPEPPLVAKATSVHKTPSDPPPASSENLWPELGPTLLKRSEDVKKTPEWVERFFTAQLSPRSLEDATANDYAEAHAALDAMLQKG